ncbi:MAG TPA: hypothetical protein VFL80_01180, partial [Thermoanaerobaculia bacterium]|nr:hypothetical protein [Thermoanaerobaculia bacterium]
MTRHDLLQSREGVAGVTGGLFLLFLLPRLFLLFGREPFYDELFTQWIARQSFFGIVEALRYDSGPPLYYFIVHALGLRSITALRVFSIICATLALGFVLAASNLGKARFTAALLLTLYPPFVLFSVDARAYALCALFIAIGVLLVDRGRPFAAAACLTAAAYSHFYGVLFFPLLLRPTAGSADESASAESRLPPAMRPIFALGLAVLLFAPGLYLASIQPREAIGWLTQTQSDASHLAVFKNFSFAGRYPAALWPPAPVWLTVAAGLALLAAASRSLRFAAAVIVPIVLTLFFGLAGRRIYFPMRFESAIAIPLILWCSLSLARWRPVVQRTLVAFLIGVGTWSAIAGISNHLSRPLDSYRATALLAGRITSPQDTVVAVGYCYLESLAHVRAKVIPFAPQQALHPGWRHR